MKPKTDLIIGMIRGYDYQQLKPFLDTLARTSYSGKLLLLYNTIDASTIDLLLRRSNTSLLPVAYAGNGAENKWSRTWPWVRRLAKRIPSVELKHKLVSFFSNIATVRFFYALKYLQAHGDAYDRVLLTDVRDVIFQDDPFREDRGAELSVFLEAPKMIFGQEPLFNDAWILNNYDHSLAQHLQGKRISCCGTVMGTTEGMTRYLELFAEELSNLRSMAWGADTSIHNKIIYGPLLDCVDIRENLIGGIATLGNVMDEDLIFDSEGWLLGDNALPIPVIHQYRPTHIASVYAAFGINAEDELY
jgi:hypothetical protein